MTDTELNDEAARLGISLYGLDRRQCVAKIAQKRAEPARGHAA